MEIIDPIARPASEENQKFAGKFVQLKNLLAELRKREIPDAIVAAFNKETEAFNSFTGSAKDEIHQLGKTQRAILKIAEKELKLVSVNYYRTLWMVLGMSAFGIPMGVALGVSTKNMGLLALGAGMDKKAKESGRQLNIEIKN